MQPAHIPDVDLLLALDGELAQDRARQVQLHLAHCWQCRTRSSELSQAITDFFHLKSTALGPKLPPVLGPAAKLKAALSAQHQTVASSWRKLALPAAVGAALVSAIFFLPGKPAAASHLPNARLTPGAIRYIQREQVCVLASEADEHKPSLQLANQVFSQYRIVNPNPRAFEVDYLITPSLGGAEDIRNLWPQPYAEGVWTAHVKDALEDYLRTKVCDGTLDIATAQAEIASNWVVAYKKYFHTSKPLPAHALFLKDLPWE